MNGLANTDVIVLPPAETPPPVVEMRGFGIGEGRTVAISIATGAALVGLWFLAARFRLVSPLFLPTPGEVATQFLAVAQEGYANATLWQHVGASLVRIFAAATIAAALGIPIGLAMGLNRWVKGIFDTPIEFYWPLPPLAYLPLMIIWFGIGETSKVLLIFLSVFAPIALGARAGVRSAAIEQIHAAYSFGATRWQVMRRVILPSAMPEILTAMRIGIGFGWTTLVAAEMVAATKGLGYMVLSASQFLQTPTVIMGIFVIAAIAYAFDMLMRFLERRLVPWKGKM
jgi:taurine transport system permease protein